ncbi:MAG: PIN domain-containing protein [Thermoplasmata archaeon]|nr:PIN domain-containing protein [Thermoplasmata archaeon]
MRSIVVDASVLVAGLFKDGRVRDTLLNADGVTFSAPLYLKAEAAKHIPRVAARAKLPQPTVEAILNDLLGAIDLVPPAVYSAFLSPARRLAHAADAVDDTEYIAICLALESPIWTLDKDFARVPGIRTLSTKDVQEL